MSLRGGSRGRLPRVCSSSFPVFFQCASKICLTHQSVTQFPSGAPAFQRKILDPLLSSLTFYSLLMEENNNTKVN